MLILPPDVATTLALEYLRRWLIRCPSLAQLVINVRISAFGTDALSGRKNDQIFLYYRNLFCHNSLSFELHFINF